MAKRNFLIIGHRAHTVADWKLDDICGGAGRLDVLVRSITASLWKSHGIRRDTDVWLSLRGKPKPDITIHFSGKNIKYLNPDERSTAALIRNGLIKLSEKKGPLETSPGVTIQRESFEELVKKLPKPALLSEKGDKEVKKIADYVIEVPDSIESITPFITVIPLQLLSYHIAVMLGKDVDQPRNLAKSVTVE